MNFAFCIYDGSYLDNNKSSDILFNNCILSLRRNSDCHIIIKCTNNVDTSFLNNHKNITIIRFKKKLWVNKKMAFRIESIYNNKWNDCDKVIVFDTDMLFQSDPFTIFDISEGFDFFYTSRYIIDTVPINEGLTGFVWSEKVRNFYKYWIEQIYNPTWKVYKNLKHTPNKGCGQLFLCCVYRNNNHFPDMKFYDATYKWNYTTLKDNFDDIYEKFKSKSVNVIHLKGPILKKDKYVKKLINLL